MTNAVQLDLFEDETEFSFLEKKIDLTHDSLHKLRKRVFAQNGELVKGYLNQQQQLDFLKNELSSLKKQMRENQHATSNNINF